MSTVLVGIVAKGNAFLPEVRAYKECLEDIGGIEVRLFSDLAVASRECRVVIPMMGFFPFWKVSAGCSVIPEYHSLSTGRFGLLKDVLKRVLGARGSAYVVLNETVRSRLRLPLSRALVRPMGVSKALLGRGAAARDRRPQAVYAGSLNRPGVLDALRRLANAGLPIHVYGNRPGDFLSDDIPGITAHGVVPPTVLDEKLTEYEYGINYTPDKWPWNVQDSTKVLEYAAAGLKIITNRYAWIDQFEHERRAAFLDIDAADSLSAIREFPYLTPDVSDLEWSLVISRSGLPQTVRALTRIGS